MPLGAAVPFKFALSDVPAYTFYPVRKGQAEALDAYSYETKLSKLARTVPPAFLRRATGVIAGRDSLTGREWLEALFAAWAARYAWFTFKPVPRMLLYAPDGPLEPLLEAMSIPQEGDGRSMRAILDDVLGVFAGYTLRVDFENDVVLVPPPWHEAAELTLELSYADLYTLPQPEVDALSMINRATVRSQAYEYRQDQQVASPAYIVRHSQSQPILVELHTTGAAAAGATYVPTQDLPEGMAVGYVLTFKTPAGESVDVTIASEAAFNNNGVTVEPLSQDLPEGSVADFKPRDRQEVGATLWYFKDGDTPVLVGGDELEIELRVRMYESDAVKRPSGYWDLTLQYDEVETVKLKRGETKTIERRHAQGPDMVLRLSLTWAERGVDVYVPYFSTGEPATDSRYAYRVDLNAFGAAWGRANTTVSATWGEDAQLGELPGAQGSRDLYGELNAPPLQSDTFPLHPEQALSARTGDKRRYQDAWSDQLPATQKNLSKIKGKWGGGGEVEQLPTKGEAKGGQATTPLYDTYQSYKKDAEDAVSREVVPPAYKEPVKDYFESIKP